MRRLLSLPALAVAAFLAACSGPAELSQPLSEPGVAPYDPRLVGMWLRVIDDSVVAVLSIKRHKNGFLVTDLMYSGTGDGDEEAGVAFLWDRRTAYATEIGGETYYSSRRVDALVIAKVLGEEPELGGFEGDVDDWFMAHPGRGYWILRPTIDEEGRMTLSYLAVDELQKQGHPGREINCGPECVFTTFDLPAEALVELIRTAPPDSIFSEDFGTFVPVDEPDRDEG